MSGEVKDKIIGLLIVICGICFCIGDFTGRNKGYANGYYTGVDSGFKRGMREVLNYYGFPWDRKDSTAGLFLFKYIYFNPHYIDQVSKYEIDENFPTKVKDNNHTFSSGDEVFKTKK